MDELPDDLGFLAEAISQDTSDSSGAQSPVITKTERSPEECPRCRLRVAAGNEYAVLLLQMNNRERTEKNNEILRLRNQLKAAEVGPV